MCNILTVKDNDDNEILFINTDNDVLWQGILTAVNPLENPGDPTGPPPNLPFLELLTEFTNKLLKQDKKVMMMEMMIIVVMMMMITMAGGADLPRQEDRWRDAQQPWRGLAAASHVQVTMMIVMINDDSDDNDNDVQEQPGARRGRGGHHDDDDDDGDDDDPDWH